MIISEFLYRELVKEFAKLNLTILPKWEDLSEEEQQCFGNAIFATVVELDKRRSENLHNRSM